MKYKYHEGMKDKPLPEDVNKEFEDMLSVLKSNVLNRGLKSIRDQRIWTDSPGAFLQNLRFGKILLWVIARDGIISKIKGPGPVTLPENKELAEDMKKNMFNDKYLTFDALKTTLGTTVDFYKEKSKKWDAKKEKKVEEDKTLHKESLENAKKAFQEIGEKLKEEDLKELKTTETVK